MPLPHITVVIPTFNRRDRLTRVLEALFRQNYPSHRVDIIVVSDGSSDGTNSYLAELAEHGRIKAINQDNQGPAAARNRGMAAAAGDFILFLDDDVVPDPNLISEHMLAHEHALRDVAVIGPLLTPPDARLSPWVDWEQRMLKKQYDEQARGLWQTSARQFYTGNASVKRNVLVATGGFDTTFRRAEDVELGYRLADRGVGFVFAQSAVGWHYAERSFQSWLATGHAYGRNDAIFARDRGQAWIASTVREEFDQRSYPLRKLIGLCIAEPWLAGPIKRAICGAAIAAGVARLSRAESAGYSALFSIQYYRGFADEMGAVISRP